MTRTLVCGWFSIDGGEATAGDLIVMSEVREMAAEVGEVDVAYNVGLTGGVDWRSVDVGAYDRVVFACGPLHGPGVEDLLDRAAGARTIAVNVSVVDRALADRFDVVIPRDDGGRAAPDLTLGREPAALPVVGVVRAHAQPEYPEGHHERVHDAVRLALASRPCAVVDFDTRVHPGADPLERHARGPDEVGALAGRMDAVIATRLHGMTLSLAAGTPVVAIDPVAGGAKVAAQARAIEWPCILVPEEIGHERLAQALGWCLTPEARERAAACARRLRPRVEALREEIRAALRGPAPLGDGSREPRADALPGRP